MQRAQWVLGGLALLLVIALVLLLAGRFPLGPRGNGTPTPTVTPAGASVAAFQGAAFACPHTPAGNCNTPASLGQQVFVGGEVRTGESGTADVQTQTTVFRLGNDTQLRFRDVSDAVTQVVLLVGRLFASHDPGGRSVVRVQSGQVTIQAIDTRFSVETTIGGIYVAVPLGGGEVTILAGARTNTVLTAGQEIFISTATNTLPAPQPLNPDEQARWDTVGCAWQQIADRLTPVALPPARCATPTATPSATPTLTPRPPTATAEPILPTATPLPQATSPPEPPSLTPGNGTAPTPTATVPPERTLPAYLGTWLNADVRTTGPPKLTITNKAATLLVQWFTPCAPHICVVNTTNAPFSGPPFAILSPDKRKMQITLEKEGTLLRLEDSDRGDTYTFRRVAARDYSGIWLNDNTDDPTLRRLVISNSSNKISVDWRSGCFVGNCTSIGPFSSEPISTDRFALSFDNVAGTRLQVDDLVQSITYYFHK